MEWIRGVLTGIGLVIFGLVAANLIREKTSEQTAELQPRALALTFAPTEKPELVALVTAAWPKVRAHCPGLDKYQDELQFKGLENHISGDAEADGVTIVFQVAATLHHIPSNYQADGHTCRFGVSPDGQRLRIQKGECASVCRDRVFESGGADYVALL
jgi:hypothetical protein